MVTYNKRYKFAVPGLLVAGLAACGGSDDGLDKLGISTQTPLVCQSPQVLNDAGTGCETPVSNCPLPLEDGPLAGTCVESLIQWPDGTNGITMPEPVYTAAQRDDGSFSEIVYYFNRESGDFDGFGLHAWNGSGTLCQAYADFDVPDGGTDWGVPIEPAGEDPNFGIYFILNLNENPVCGNFIPYNFNAGIQSDADLQVDLASPDLNPSGNFYVLARNEADRYDAGTIFPYPRTYASLVLPDGFEAPEEPLVCEAPEVLSEDGTECLAPVIEQFIPGEVTLYLRGSFNDWGTADDEFALDDTVAFHYADNVYTATLTLEPREDGSDHIFKIADEGWSEATSFGAATGEEAVELDVGKTMFTGKDANGDDIEQNISIAVMEATTYQFTMDATDATAPVLTVTPVPLSAQLYIRGGMNDWGNGDDGSFSLASGTTAMRYQGDNLYSAIINLAAAEEPYAFKVADPGWTAETNFGAVAGDEEVMLDVSKTLTFGEESQNLSFAVSEDAAFEMTLDVTDPTMPVFTVSDALPFQPGTTLYLRGSFNDWGNNGDDFALTDADAFHYADNIYTATISLAASDSPYAFKIASQGWEDATSFGGLADDTEVSVNAGPKELFVPEEMGTENLSITVTEDSNLQFTVDITDPEAPTVTVMSTPLAGALYVRGSMNDWANDGDGNFSLASGTQVLRYQGGNLYTTELALEADSHAFKVADPGWTAETNFGAVAGDEAVVLNEAKTLTFGEDSQNLSFENAEAATYLLSVDVTDPAAPVFRMTEQAPFGAESIYLRGSMVGWDNPSNSPLVYTGDGIYEIDFDLTAERHNFKIAGRDWDTTTLDYGSDPSDLTVEEGVTKTMVLKMGDGTNDNLVFDAPEAATYKFTVDANNTTSPTVTVER